MNIAIECDADFASSAELQNAMTLGPAAIHQANSYALQLYKQFGLATKDRPIL
jgi:hypothetical protein